MSKIYLKFVFIIEIGLFSQNFAFIILKFYFVSCNLFKSFCFDISKNFYVMNLDLKKDTLKQNNFIEFYSKLNCCDKYLQ